MTEAARSRSEGVVPSKIPSTSPLHEPWALTPAQRERFRRLSTASRLAKAAALAGDGPAPLHDINTPVFSPLDLMPEQHAAGVTTLSLFSGGGGLDLGFERAGAEHVAAFEILEDAAATLVKARPAWNVYGGSDGDVRHVDFRPWSGQLALLHGGPPCQPFSHAGRGRGAEDPRDMWPHFVRAVRQTKPAAFVAENVAALTGQKFADYVRDNITGPLAKSYEIAAVVLYAPDFGLPQVRRRVFFVGFRSRRLAARWAPPTSTHSWPQACANRARTLGAREALGLPDIGFDDLAPTIRSTLTGPRHTTSILNSVSAKQRFDRLGIWPSGVAPTREQARAFVAPNGGFRLSVPDVALLQGFPEDWPFVGATYMQLGQIGNAVPPILGYAVARSVIDLL